MYRTPTTTVEASRALYRTRYEEGFTTELPHPEQLAEWLRTEFRDTPKDYGAIVALLRSAGVSPGARVFDLGCSWGYGSWQLARAGWAVEAFELDPRRAEFAREHLGVKVHSSLEDVQAPFDVFFSSHVLEHVPRLSEMLERAFEWLRPGGLFVAFTPNGSKSRRRRAPVDWHRAWGEVHPNLLDEEFYRARFGDPFLSSSPHDSKRVARWTNTGTCEPTTLAGSELLAIVKK